MWKFTEKLIELFFCQYFNYICSNQNYRFQNKTLFKLQRLTIKFTLFYTHVGTWEFAPSLILAHHSLSLSLSLKVHGYPCYIQVVSTTGLRCCSFNMRLECPELGVAKAKEAGEIPQKTGPPWKLLQAIIWRHERTLNDDPRSLLQTHQSLRWHPASCHSFLP